MGKYLLMNKTTKIGIMLAISLRISSWNFSITRWRVVTGVLRQDGKAFLAADTADLNSSSVVKGSFDTTSCVAY